MADGHTTERARDRVRTAPPDARRAAGPAVPVDGGPRPEGDGQLRDDRSVGQLLRELGNEGRDLLRGEVALVKAEMREKIGVYERNIGSIAVGGALLLAALLLVLWAINNALTALIDGIVGIEVAIWLAPLIMAGVLGLIGWSMVNKGRNTIRDEGIVPDQSMDELKEDKRWVERKVKS